jgi:ankyrin repeat protein
MTALMHAAASGSVECVRVLLDHGASVSVEDDEGHTAAHYCRADLADELRALLAAYDKDYLFK